MLLFSDWRKDFPMRLPSNTLLLERLPTKQVGAIHLPPSALDDFNNAQVKMFRLIQKGPGRLTKKGVRIEFEAEPGDHLIVWPITTGPQDVGNGQFILKKPQESVLAVFPMQRSNSQSLHEK